MYYRLVAVYSLVPQTSSFLLILIRYKKISSTSLTKKAAQKLILSARWIISTNTLSSSSSYSMLTSIHPSPSSDNGTTTTTTKRKRRPAGTPDPDAEVVALSPKTLLESDRYVCEICNQGFQRDQNLQMHRRRHKVPWKLLKRETPAAAKRVFVCPESSCLHHDRRHALGDLVGIKKHYRRKHSNQRQWVCERCAKGYAVQSDYKAHLKTCGTRGHSCDCGRVFSRVESFIEHQDACSMGQLRSENHRTPPPPPPPPPPCLSRTQSTTPTPSSDTNPRAWAAAGPASLPLPKPPSTTEPIFLTTILAAAGGGAAATTPPNLELQLRSTSTKQPDEDDSTQLQLSIDSPSGSAAVAAAPPAAAAGLIKEQAREHLRMAVAEKAFAEVARQQARRQIQVAEEEFARAKRIRQQAQAEMEKARELKEQAAEQMKAAVMQVTCHSCKRNLQQAEYSYKSINICRNSFYL
ncbi:hypothetical protein ACP275_04G120500 [Erythranthe tilingii]